MKQYTSKPSFTFSQPNNPQIRIQSPQNHTIKSYPPRSPHSNHRPLHIQQHSPKNTIITRTNSKSKQPSKMSLQKNKKQNKIEKYIKFAKVKKQSLDANSVQNKNDITFFDNDLATMSGFNFLQDSIQTIHKSNYFSNHKNGKAIRQNSASKKQLRTHQQITDPSAVNFNREKQEQYYSYWKAKAHEYLQSNMKLMQQVSILTKQNQKLQQQLISYKIKTNVQVKQVDEKQQKGQVYEIMRKSNLYYMSKMEQLQKQLKSKQVLIESFNKVIKDQNRLISGDNQRINLMNKMKQEIAYLQSEIRRLNQQLDTIKYKEKPFSQHKEQYAKHKAKLKELQYKK